MFSLIFTGLLTGGVLLFGLILGWKILAPILYPLLKIIAVCVCLVVIWALFAVAVNPGAAVQTTETENADGSVSVNFNLPSRNFISMTDKTARRLGLANCT
jgi:hypothetical protein